MFSTSALCLTQYWNIPDSDIAYVNARPTNPGSLSPIIISSRESNEVLLVSLLSSAHHQRLPVERGTEMNATAATKNELSMSILMPNHLVVIR